MANTVYNEPYFTMPMNHFWHINEDEMTINYGWKKGKNWYSMEVIAENNSTKIVANSEEAFITEHYWGYTKLNNTTTSEFGVEHPSWETYKIKNYTINADFQDLYGDDFAFLNQEKPLSVLLAEGSKIEVKNRKKLKKGRFDVYKIKNVNKKNIKKKNKKLGLV